MPSITKETDTTSRDALILAHLDIVKYVVHRMTLNLPPGVERDDLMSIGSWGLIDAAKKFDPTKGAQFKTYAVTRIRGAILDELRRLSLGGQALCRKTRNLEKAVRAVESRHNRTATEIEIAAELGISVDELWELYSDVSRSFLISLDASDENEESAIYSIQDVKTIDPSDYAERMELRDTLTTVINELPDQEKKVLALYYFEELTLKEIGGVLGVSESRISQIHSKAIVRIRSRLHSNQVM